VVPGEAVVPAEEGPWHTGRGGEGNVVKKEKGRDEGLAERLKRKFPQCGSGGRGLMGSREVAGCCGEVGGEVGHTVERGDAVGLTNA
jgi:hypothetical protein